MKKRSGCPPSETMRAILKGKKAFIKDIKPKYGLNSFLGLMFRRQGRALIELPRPSSPAIHTFFMCFSLDLVFLRRLKETPAGEGSANELPDTEESYLTRVVYLKEEARPWGDFVSPEPAGYVLEVEAGLAEEKGITKGDLIRLEEQR